ncbi:MAG TPA: hypothetical protein PLG14_05120 [Spirochaetales bacterium]|nr:hypothetical protein [Spirochaetales bacterium]
MKRTTFVLALVLLAASLAGAQTAALSPLSAKDPRSMALGGAFTALSSGYSALSGNPAGFAAAKAELMVADFSSWLYVKPTSANLEKAARLASGGADDAEILSAMNDLITENGFGGGLSFGAGYVGKGLGVGMFLVGDSSVKGETAMGAVMTSSASLNAVLGLGAPIRIGGLTVSLGGDVRPFFRAESADGGWAFGEIMSGLMSGGDVGAVFMGESVESGFGLAMDFGASVELGSLSVGLSIRDVAPSFIVSEMTVEELLAELGAGSFPRASCSSQSVLVLPSVTAGLAWKPRLVPGLVEPALYFEVQDPVSVIRDRESFWNLLHVGAEVELLSFFSLRAGLNKGWPSAGFGLDLAFLSLDAAVFTEELGRRPGDLPRSGATISAAIRF